MPLELPRTLLVARIRRSYRHGVSEHLISHECVFPRVHQSNTWHFPENCRHAPESVFERGGITPRRSVSLLSCGGVTVGGCGVRGMCRSDFGVLPVLSALTYRFYFRGDIHPLRVLATQAVWVA